ncbi:septal ring lytic transglycosylase RlpA family lipoprotein [Methylibium sp. Pch-M]|uniref:septal ring lytic transglycosylase RlpA family protein n=1 Tax=Methylibium sp. Pch-M TaxID=2082386 RepID=UPI00101087F0|nr:septal ring lytic transglycosylase RlpA family protein [Methylibium sp. Pch-M]QAZ39283.1 septal ring lytic transglycosylase RlpA family lipoprotein [Methylibium sp. Pch-M]
MPFRRAPCPPCIHARSRALLGAMLAALLVACGSAPTRPGAASGRDGPAAEIPPDLARTPDAEPRVEPIRSGGPNKPYEVLGRNYTPETRDVPIKEKGLASWYGRKFHGRKTASGEIYNMHAMTAAHKTMPLPSYARVRNPANGREVVVRINDRGPFVAGRVIDLSYTAALKLDLLRGVGQVEVERITYEDIRTGAWRRDAAPTAVAAVTAPETMPAPASSSEPVPDASPAAEASEPPGSPVASGAPGRALTSGARGYWVQLGAFRERGGAESFQQRVSSELDWLAPLMAVFSEAPLYRLQAGPYASRDEAQGAAQRVRDALQLVPVIIERR